MQLVSKIFHLCDHDPPASQMDRQADRQTDRQVTSDSKTMLCTVVHCTVKIRETMMGFLWIPLNPMSLTCGLTAAEATQGKEHGKDQRMIGMTHSPEVSAEIWTVCHRLYGSPVT